MTMRGLIQNLAHGAQAQFSNATLNVVTILPSSVPTTTDGCTSAEEALHQIDEKVHVIIVNRASSNPQNWKFSREGMNSGPGVATHVLRYAMGEEFEHYEGHEYDFNGVAGINGLGGHGEIFLPFVFEGETTRILCEECQATIPKGPNEGTRFQNDMASKLEQLAAMGRTAARLSYMLYFGLDAVEEYRNDQREIQDLDALIARPITNLGEVRQRLADHRYRRILRASNYGLWGKWYIGGNGWHRGIDTNFGGSIHCICSGVVVDVRNSWFNIFVRSMGVTFTYMHLIRRPEIVVGSWVNTGDIVGTESNVGTNDVHTHIEVNPNSYTGYARRPWSNDYNQSMGNPEDIGEIRPGAAFMPGEYFSLNPYPHIENVWRYHTMRYHARAWGRRIISRLNGEAE